MLNETQFDPGVVLWSRRREHLQLGVGKVACLLPDIEHVLNSGRRGQWQLISWCLCLCFWTLLIHVVTADLVLCAVTTDGNISNWRDARSPERVCSPLRERLITSDMSTLACLASCSALGVTAPRGTSALTSHGVFELNNRVVYHFSYIESLAP